MPLLTESRMVVRNAMYPMLLLPPERRKLERSLTTTACSEALATKSQAW